MVHPYCLHIYGVERVERHTQNCLHIYGINTYPKIANSQHKQSSILTWQLVVGQTPEDRNVCHINKH